MAIAARSAQTIWQGTLGSGTGAIRAEATGSALGELPVSWAARTGDEAGQTNPEELCAAAHSSCFAMALALMLGERGARPERLEVRCTVTLDEVDGVPTIVSSGLEVEGTIPGMDSDGFSAAIADAEALCPVSRLFAGAAITVDARLAAG